MLHWVQCDKLIFMAACFLFVVFHFMSFVSELVVLSLIASCCPLHSVALFPDSGALGSQL